MVRNSARHAPRKAAAVNTVTVLDATDSPTGQKASADLSSDAMREMHAFWLSHRNGDNIPHADVIDPLALPRGALPWIVLTDVEHHPLRFKFRLVGTQIVESEGQNFAGYYADEMPGMETQIRRFSWCVENRRPYFATSRLTFSPMDYKSYDVLGLPFADAGGRVTRILFVMSFAFDNGRMA